MTNLDERIEALNAIRTLSLAANGEEGAPKIAAEDITAICETVLEILEWIKVRTVPE